jgi:hypothetical protein
MMIAADKLTNTQYHAKKDYTSSSDVKAVHGTTLAHWKSKKYGSTSAMAIGTAVHSFVLENGADIIKGPETRRGKAWTDMQEEADANDHTLLTTADYDLARGVADSVLFHPAGQRIAYDNDSTINEASFFVTDPESGLNLKCRPDSFWPEKGVIYDIKTCRDASERGVQTDVHGFGYALQSVFYMYCLGLAGYNAEQFVFINVEKTGSYEVSTNILSNEYLAWAEVEMHSTLRKIADANEAQVWDTGWNETRVIDLPRWLQSAAEF